MKTKRNKRNKNKVKKAVAILHPDKHYSKKNRVKGRVKFTQKNNKLYINYNIQYLPKGYHGFHIHKYGDLTEGCKTAGPHFNTYKKNIHGGPKSKIKHNGDLGNIYNMRSTTSGTKIVSSKILNLNKFEYSLNCKITDIKREGNQIKIIHNNQELIFDFLVLATHADQALKLLGDPTLDEIEILSKFQYTKNKAFLHSDIEIMPKNKNTWSSWNFIKNKKNSKEFTLSYWMNNLQKLKTRNNYFVTINPTQAPNYIHDETVFTHPKFDFASHKAQKMLKDIQGIKHTFFCGSYHGFGFHEDGIQSAAYIAKLLEVDIPWKRDNSFYNRLQYF